MGPRRTRQRGRLSSPIGLHFSSRSPAPDDNARTGGWSCREHLTFIRRQDVGRDCGRADVVSKGRTEPPFHDALHPGELLYLREALAAHGVEADHVKIWQTVGKLRRRHGLVMSGEPREPGYRVRDWTWEAKRVRNTVQRS